VLPNLDSTTRSIAQVDRQAAELYKQARAELNLSDLADPERSFTALQLARRLYQTGTMSAQLQADVVESGALEKLIRWAGTQAPNESAIELTIERLRNEVFDYVPQRSEA